MKPTVLMFNLSAHKVSVIRVLAQKFGLKTVVVPPEHWGNRMGDIFAGTHEDCPAKEAFTEEMIVMDLPRTLMDFFLNGLRREHVTVELKAARTPTNDTWPADDLYHELCAEREAFRQGTVAHRQEPEEQ